MAAKGIENLHWLKKQFNHSRVHTMVMALSDFRKGINLSN